MEFNNNIEETKSLKDYIAFIKLNWKPIVISTLMGTIAALIIALSAVDIYESTTSLKITKPSGSILEAPMIPEFQDFGSDRFIANEIEILKSYSIRERVVNSLIDSFKTIKSVDSFKVIIDKDKLEENNKFPIVEKEELIKDLTSIVSIEQKRGLDIVEIKAESPSAFEAALISNVYANEYKKLNLENNRELLTQIRKFLEQQRTEKLEELRNSENLMGMFQNKEGIIAIDEQAKALIEQLSTFEAQRNGAQIELTMAEKNLNQYKEELRKQDSKLADYLESFASEEYLKTLQKSIAELEVKKDLALNDPTLSKNKTLINEYDQKLNDLKKKLNEKINVYKSGIFASSPEEIKPLSQKIIEEEVKAQSLKASIDEQNKIVRNYESRFNKLPKTTIELARLERERTALEKLYLIVEEKYQEATINEQSQPGNVLIVDPGIRPNESAKPNRKLIVLIGLILGGGIGLGFVFLRDYMDNTIKTPEDIEKQNMNLLAWLPQIDELLVGNKNEVEFIVKRKPDAIPSEAFRTLRTRIQFSKVGANALKTLMITSPSPGEGKTTVSLNLSGSFALNGMKTLLFDTDLRKPRVHNAMGANRIPGFVDYFFDQVSYEEIVRKSDLENLYYITTGTIPPNPSEILGSKQMQTFIDKLKKEFDIIIFDTAPIIAVSDSEILATYVDATLLVISANKTEKELVKRSVDVLSKDKNNFIGLVLNNFVYRNGYGSYYKYYYYYSHPQNGNGSINKKTEPIKK
ncbi:MAG: exopolysaccharide regulatory tyrosine autokinase VpsO [Ignavibacterium sp.]